MGVELKSLTLKEEQRLRIFRNIVLRRIPGLQRHEILQRRKSQVPYCYYGDKTRPNNKCRTSIKPYARAKLDMQKKKRFRVQI
jgi:hypothetical protein